MIVNKVKNFFCKRSTKWEDKYEESVKSVMTGSLSLINYIDNYKQL